MTIKILPPQLANQIAAGEVVERPASVVKELVENALDAGATNIDVEIEKGGHKKILIRDNGKGVDKAQLTLALSRHATSKIANMDDLEAIASLGFRGEALASISSVARLTMTSKPASQSEAWSAIAEGLAMDVKVMPAAHPDGTSVEVLDLFFNTPARRKFLRAEKTEFSHIETLLKRIALSRPDVGFCLKHNGKTVKRFRAQNSELTEVEQKSNRIADVVSKRFVDEISVVSSVYDDITISVWAKAPSLCVSVNPAQYSFVNGRMMRDKLIQHAIRQAYGQRLHKEQLPEYVIFIDLPVTDVDVNVHPAKHEVRFHHARLLHDLLLKTIQDALAAFDVQQQSIDYSAANSTAPHSVAEPIQDVEPLRSDNDVSTPPDWLKTGADAPTQNVEPEYKRALQSTTEHSSAFPGLTSKKYGQGNVAFQPAQRNINHQALNDAIDNSLAAQQNTHNSNFEPLAEVVFIQAPSYVYFQFEQCLWLIEASQLFADDNKAGTAVARQSSAEQEQKLTMTPLLVPVRLKLSPEEKDWSQHHVALLLEHGFDLKLHQQFLIIKQVPNILRSGDANKRLPNLFNDLMQSSQNAQSLVAKVLNDTPDCYNKSQIQTKLNELAKQSDFTNWLADHARALDAQHLLEH